MFDTAVYQLRPARRDADKLRGPISVRREHDRQLLSHNPWFAADRRPPVIRRSFHNDVTRDVQDARRIQRVILECAVRT